MRESPQLEAGLAGSGTSIVGFRECEVIQLISIIEAEGVIPISRSTLVCIYMCTRQGK